MEAYAQVLLYAIPGFFGLIFIEVAFGWFKGKQTFNSMDTISSLSSGITNTLKSILGLTVIIISYSWLVDKIALVDIKATTLVYVLSFFAIDFASYWNHRLNHAINVFWNRHIIHHSSEEFNLACALRQEISEIWGIGALFLLPAALLGLPGEVIAVIGPIHLFMQFWYHTRHIPKLGFLEYLIVTPSQHRVHHAINDIYIDKNLGAIFPYWDFMFGTFQEELDEVPCVYGVKKAPNTWNPIKINFQHLWQLIKDAWHAEKWIDKLKIWWMPTGWRPDDVKTKYPIQVITDPYAYEKYAPKYGTEEKIWAWFQFIFANAFVLHMLFEFANIGFPNMFYYGGFIFMHIYAYSSFMDKENYSWIFEIVKSIVGFTILYLIGNWFVGNQILAYAMMAYLVISPIITFYLSSHQTEVQISLKGTQPNI
ncbi:MAG: sterol desaturase family protein [Bacteroidota bacterium]